MGVIRDGQGHTAEGTGGAGGGGDMGRGDAEVVVGVDTIGGNAHEERCG